MDDPNIWNTIGTGVASTIAAVASWFAYQVKKDAKACLNEDQVRLLIEDKLKEITVSQRFLAERLDRIEDKLDKILLNVDHGR